MNQAATGTQAQIGVSPQRERVTWVGRYAELIALAAGIVVALLLITVPLPGDPMNYLEAAENLPSTPLHHGSTRLGITAPVWLLTLVFGFSEIAFYVVPILAFGGLAAATTNVGKRLFGHWVGLGAAALVLTSPWILTYGTQLLPDIPSAALLTGSLGLVLSTPRDSSRHTRAWLAGLAFGLAYLVKETSLLFGPALLGVMLLRGHRAAFIMRFTFAAAGVAVLEALAGVVLWSDPLARISSLLNRSGAVPTAERTAAFEAAFAAQRNPIASFSILPQLLWQSWHGRLLLVLGLVLVGAAVKGGTRFRLLLAWILIPWISLALVGSIQPESGRPVIRLMLDRYWAPLLPPLAVGGLGALAILARRLRHWSPRAGMVAVTGLVALSGFGAALGVGASLDARPEWFIRFGNEGYWQLRTVLHQFEGSPVLYVDRLPSKLVRLYTNDPLGRSVFGGEVTSTPNSLDAVDVVLVEFNYSSASAGVDPPDVLAAQSLLDVSSDLRWAMYGEPVKVGSGLSELDDDMIEPETWQVRLVTDGKWGAPQSPGSEPTVLTAAQALVVFDSGGPYGAAPEEPTLDVVAGSTVSFDVAMQSEGGRIRAICDFFPEGGAPRIRVPAAALLDEGPDDDIVAGVCQAPQTDGPYDVRVVMTVSGPAHLELEEGRLVTYSRETAN